MRSGVAGIGKSVIPSGARASRIAFITVGVEATVPPSPTPLAPNGFVVLETGLKSTLTSGNVIGGSALRAAADEVVERGKRFAAHFQVPGIGGLGRVCRAARPERGRRQIARTRHRLLRRQYRCLQRAHGTALRPQWRSDDPRRYPVA